jgi:hypothetical protein
MGIKTETRVAIGNTQGKQHKAYSNQQINKRPAINVSGKQMQASRQKR